MTPDDAPQGGRPRPNPRTSLPLRQGAPKPQVDRIHDIETRLRQGGIVVARDLAREYGTDRRTTQRDLALLLERHPRAIRRDAAGRYRWVDGGGPPLNDVQALATYMAARLLTHHGLADEHHRSAVLSLASRVPAPGRGVLERRATAAPSARESARGRVFDHVARAWFGRWALDCLYHSHAGSSRKRLAIHCVEMGRRNHQPYVLAVDLLSSRPKVGVYRLSRMEGTSVTDCEVDVPVDFDPDAFMGDAFGVVRGASVRIQVRVPNGLCSDFIDAAGPAYRSDTPNGDEATIVEIAATVTNDGSAFETVAWLLSWGAKVEVLSPERVRSDVAEAFTKAATLYGAARS